MTVPISLNTISNLQDTTTAQTNINANSAAITGGFSTALNVIGDQMKGNLDMNSQQILNLPAPATANSPLRLTDAVSGLSSQISIAVANLTSSFTSPTVTSFSATAGQVISSGAAGGVMTITLPSTSSMNSLTGVGAVSIIKYNNGVTVNAASGQTILLPVGPSGGGGSYTSWGMPNLTNGGSSNYDTATLIFNSNTNAWIVSGTPQVSEPSVPSFAYPYPPSFFTPSGSVTNALFGVIGGVAGHQIPFADNNIYWAQNSVYPNIWVASNSYAVGYAPIVVSGVASGVVYALSFSSSTLTPNSITSSYTAVAGDTASSVAYNLSQNIISNTSLMSPSTGYPIIADPTPYNNGDFNVQWTVQSEPITVTSVGAGTLTLPVYSNYNALDSVVYKFLRQPGNYTPLYYPEQRIQIAIDNTYLNTWRTSATDAVFVVEALNSGTAANQFSVGNGVVVGNVNSITGGMPGQSNLMVQGTITATGTIKASSGFIVPNYTVTTLPAGVTGLIAMVTDATATTYGSVVSGGSTNVVTVFYTGSAWHIG